MPQHRDSQDGMISLKFSSFCSKRRRNAFQEKMGKNKKNPYPASLDPFEINRWHQAFYNKTNQSVKPHILDRDISNHSN